MNPAYQDELTTLYCGNCRDIMRLIPSNSISLINTDPPYIKSKLREAYTILADESYRVMSDNASLTMLVGHFAVGDVTLIMSNSKLKWNWIICMNQPIAHARMALGIEVTWMPILWYVKSDKYLGAYMKDSFTVTGTDGILKPLHPWQKDTSWSDFFVGNLACKGSLVLDPFMGTGTTIISARKMGRHSIGIDIDPECVSIAIDRIKSSGV